MRNISLNSFYVIGKKKIKRISEIEAENIAKNAIDITKKEMMKHNKRGKIYRKNGFSFRRSDIGQVIAREPALFRKGASTYDSLVKIIQPRKTGSYESFEVGLEDRSDRAEYKSEYLRNGTKLWVKNLNSLYKGRDEKGYLRDGRTSIGFGLYNAVKKFVNENKLTNESINILKKW